MSTDDIVRTVFSFGPSKRGRVVRFDLHSEGQRSAFVEWFYCYRPPRHSWVRIYNLEKVDSR